jgi:hypothetical protein
MDGSPEQHLAAAARVSRQQALRLAAPEPEPEREPEPLTAFRSLFRDGRAESSAFQGSLGESGLRSVAWKAFLGVVPPSPDRWTESIESQRAAYADLKRKWLPDPDAVEDMDPTLNNPLCPVDDSPWAKVGAMLTRYVGRSALLFAWTGRAPDLHLGAGTLHARIVHRLFKSAQFAMW